MGEHNIRRGEKWKIAKAKAIFMVEQGRGTQKEADWFDTQESIVNDIKEYEDSINKPTTEKPKKADKGA